MMLIWSFRMISHTRTETPAQTLTKGSNDDSWTMGERLIQQYGVREWLSKVALIKSKLYING